jgi:hypothetical protein
MKPVLPLAAAVAAALIGAVPAAAAPRPRLATFEVVVEGVQTTTWTKHHEREFPCDVGIDGEGRETYRFTARRPSRVTAMWVPGARDPISLFSGHGAAAVYLRGTVTRQGRLDVTPGEACASGDGTGTAAPEPADCGTIRGLADIAEVRFDTTRRSLLVLDDALTPAGRDPFSNCPGGGGWPDLLQADDAGRRIGRVLPAADLLAHGQNVVLARGSRTDRSAEGTATTTIRWTASFKRVGRR